jgi:hypothetical protein
MECEGTPTTAQSDLLPQAVLRLSLFRNLAWHWHYDILKCQEGFSDRLYEELLDLKSDQVLIFAVRSRELSD